MSLDDKAAVTRRITALSVAVACVLVVIKIIAWRGSDSVAMLASAADSGLDLIASLVTFYAVRYAAAPPDAEHRFGHGKAEAFASLVQAGLVFASAALVAREAIGRLIAPSPVAQGAWAIGVMAISIALTLGLITAQNWALKSVQSVAVSGDRAHYASDLASNAAALIGIAGAALFGFGQLDAIAGLVVTGILVASAIKVFGEASNQLMDRELPEADRRRIVQLAAADPRLQEVHELRTRMSGPYVHVQMHVELDPELPLQDAHEVMVAAENRILAEFPAADIIIHPDPRGRAEPHSGPFAEDRVGMV